MNAISSIASLAFVLLLAPGISAQTPESCTGLEAAAKAGDAGRVKALLGCGADPNVRGERGASPLFWAAMAGSTDVARVLIAHGADVNAVDGQGYSALHVAAYWNRRGTTELLVASGADLNAKGDGGWTPLHKVLERLLVGTILADMLETEDAELDTANAASIATYLIERGASVTAASDGGETALHFAAASGHVGVVEALLARGADVDVPGVEGVTPLYAATKYNRTDVVRVLIDSGADVNRRTTGGFTPLMWAAYTGNFAISDLLIAHGAKTTASNHTGTTALFWALASAAQFESESGRKAHAEWLAQLDAVDQAAARVEVRNMKKQWHDVALLLIEHGADVNASRSADPTTLLYMAAITGDVRIVGALLDKGAVIDTRDARTYESPLHAAISEQHGGVAGLLVRRGADVNDRNGSGRTPLHYLARDLDDPELAELMIQRGALVNAEDRDGNTPLDFAIAAWHPNVARVLQKSGGLQSGARQFARAEGGY